MCKSEVGSDIPVIKLLYDLIVGKHKLKLKYVLRLIVSTGRVSQCFTAKCKTL